MAAPSDIERAAQQAADRVKEYLIHMLTHTQVGEIAIIVGYTQLEIEQRRNEKKKVIRVARGEHVVIEHVR
jgi:hypothetical protein